VFSATGMTADKKYSENFCPPDSLLVPLCSFCTPRAEKGLFQSRLFCHRTGFTDTGPFKIDTAETPAIKIVKPFMVTHRAGVMVRAYRADAHIAVLQHNL